MASVTKNLDGTFLVSLTEKEDAAVTRLAQEPPVATVAAKIETQLTGWCASIEQDYLNTDGPTRLQQFATLSLPKQKRVDAILNGA